MPTVSLLLKAADVLMFRDSRPFDAGDSGAQSIFPTPQTVAGAVRTWLLRSASADLKTLKGVAPSAAAMQSWAARYIPEALWVVEASLMGPLLMVEGGPRYPLPRHLAICRSSTSSYRVASPLQAKLPGRSYFPRLAGASDLLPVRPRGSEDFDLASGGLIGQAQMSAALQADGTIAASDVDGLAEYMLDEHRLGIGVNAGAHTAEKGMIYSGRFLRPDHGVSLRVDITSTDAALRQKLGAAHQKAPWLRLGGEGRVAGIEILDAVALPCAITDWPAERFTTCLITPGRFADGGWLPRLPGCRLVAAAGVAPVSCSGWNSVEGRPTETRYAVMAGAVYFWERIPDAPDIADPHGTSLCDQLEERQAGWGYCLRGEWNYV